MEKNTIKGIKTLEQLARTLKGISFADLTDSEKETVVTVFKVNTGANEPEEPLTEAGFNYILNILNEEEETMEVTNIKEEVVMEEQFVKELAEAAVADMQEENTKEETIMTNVKSNVKNVVNGGKEVMTDGAKAFKETMDEFRKSAGGAVSSLKTGEFDKHVTATKDTLVKWADNMALATGAHDLKVSIMNILYVNGESTSDKNGIRKSAKECRDAVNAYIDNLISYKPTKEDWKKAAMIKGFCEDENGRNIFDAFAHTIIGICNNAIAYIKLKFNGLDESKNVFSKVACTIGRVCGAIIGIISSAALFVLRTVVLVGSYIGSVAIHAIAFVVEQIIKGGKAVANKAGQVKDTATKKMEEVKSSAVRV